MAKYAAQTNVPIERSKNEIERTLLRYGVEEFFYGRSSRGSGIAFKHNGRLIKMNVPTPKRSDYRDNQLGEKAWNQVQRQRWRILLLGIKAKLELVDAGVTSFEDEFLAQTCLPTGETFSQALKRLSPAQVEKMLGSGQVPKLLAQGSQDEHIKN